MTAHTRTVRHYPMPANLAGTTAAEDIALPMPPPRLAALGPMVASLDHTASAAMAMDAGDRTHKPAAATVEDARRDGFDNGLRAGAERRTWWDVMVGIVWGAMGLILLMAACAGAGWLSVKIGAAPAEIGRAPTAAQPAPEPRVPTQAADWASRT